MNLLQAYSFLNMITEGKDGYLDDYKKYIITHKANVSKFAGWLKKSLPEVFDNVDTAQFDAIIAEHDDSKYSEEEFIPYANFWANKHDEYIYDPEYEAAWEHHWMHNEHHPEHWLGNDMPYIYILEMLCDWGSFSIASGNYHELIDYYYNEAKDDDEKNLSENTKVIIEEILNKINFIISNGGE